MRWHLRGSHIWVRFKETVCETPGIAVHPSSPPIATLEMSGTSICFHRDTLLIYRVNVKGDTELRLLSLPKWNHQTMEWVTEFGIKTGKADSVFLTWPTGKRIPVAWCESSDFDSTAFEAIVIPESDNVDYELCRY